MSIDSYSNWGGGGGGGGGGGEEIGRLQVAPGVTSWISKCSDM